MNTLDEVESDASSDVKPAKRSRLPSSGSDTSEPRRSRRISTETEKKTKRSLFGEDKEATSESKKPAKRTSTRARRSSREQSVEETPSKQLARQLSNDLNIKSPKKTRRKTTVNIFVKITSGQPKTGSSRNND